MSGLFTSLTGLTLESPGWLLAALLVPVAVWLGLRDRVTATFAPGGFLGPRTPVAWRVVLLPTPLVLQALALVLVVVALARPVRRVPLPLDDAGIDIVLCLDTSSSMLSNDLDAARSRLDVAKEAAARFIARREHDRIALIRFARYPDVRCPPTLDHDALGQILDAVTTVDADGPEDATGIGTAVARAAQVLGDDGAASRVVVVLTDGEENVATADRPQEIAPLHAGQLCERLGIRVYTIAAGVGRPGKNGSLVPLDTKQVEALSARTGGRFFAARDAAALDAVYGEIDALEVGAQPDQRYRIEDAHLALLASALVLLVSGRVLGLTVLRVLP